MTTFTRDDSVVAIISGKGGAGKTCLALGLAKYLSHLGRKVLLVDLDLGTHGATYFLKQEAHGGPSLADWSPDRGPQYDPGDLVRSTPHGFDFIPSQSHLLRREPFPWSPETLACILLARDTGRAYDHVVLDCQAGYNTVAECALQLASRAVVVAEADAVSAAAARDVERQFGTAMPDRTFLLVSKLYLREAASYRALREYLSAFGHLPPIPFDFDVRASFGKRQVPLDPQKPTSHFFAISRIASDLFPELADQIDEFADSARNRRSERVRELLDGLAARRREAWAAAMDPRPMVALAAAASMAAMLGIGFLWRESGPLNSGDWARVAAGIAAVFFGATAALGLLLRRGGPRTAPPDVRQLDDEIHQLQTLLVTEDDLVGATSDAASQEGQDAKGAGLTPDRV